MIPFRLNASDVFNHINNELNKKIFCIKHAKTNCEKKVMTICFAKYTEN